MMQKIRETKRQSIEQNMLYKQNRSLGSICKAKPKPNLDSSPKPVKLEVARRAREEVSFHGPDCCMRNEWQLLKLRIDKTWFQISQYGVLHTLES